MNKATTRPKGFTLIEVMVALMIIAISLAAIIDSTASSTWRASYLKEKTLASWVAQNQIALYRAKKSWGSKLDISGEATMAGQTWAWKMHLTKTENTRMREINVEVYLEGDDALKANVSGFVTNL